MHVEDGLQATGSSLASMSASILACLAACRTLLHHGCVLTLAAVALWVHQAMAMREAHAAAVEERRSGRMG